jgi:hypothetical protein
MKPVARLAFVLLGVVTWQGAAGASTGSIKLSENAVKQAGIVVQAVEAARFSPTVEARGRVLDPSPILSLYAKLSVATAKQAAAQAILQFSQKQEARARILYGNNQAISEQKLQQAEQAAATAQAAFSEAQSSRRALVNAATVSWGNALAASMRQPNDPLLARLAKGTAVLIGLGLPPATALPSPPQHATARAAGKQFPIVLIGPVRRMVGSYPGESFLYQAAAQPAVPIGTAITAALPSGPGRAAVRVPAAAVVWRNGDPLVFRALTKNTFQPVRIATGSQINGDYFVSAGLAPGDQVVVRGAGFLLGADSRSYAAPSGDD